MNCTAFIYYVTLMAKRTCMCLIESSVKIITIEARSFRVPIQVSQDGFMLRLICMF